MIKDREIEPTLKRLASQYPVVTVTGPRQSGKTTLCKKTFPDKPYVSMENLDIRQFAGSDPNGFLREFKNGAILDEIQRVPDLLSYIQTWVDEKNEEGLFILTGSQQFDLHSKITQTLAGRTALLCLLPFSFKEAYDMPVTLEEILYRGFYPRLFDKALNPTEALGFYCTTYIERDVRSLANIIDLSKFEIFLKLCAARTGQILNLSNLSQDCGISHNTAKQWLSILEASYILTFLRPYHANINKRLVKSPKLYFLDTGLAAFLLDIQTPSQLQHHPLKGSLFETFVVVEILKHYYATGKRPNLSYFRDSNGREVDLILTQGDSLFPIEIKSSETVSTDFFKNLTYLTTLLPHCEKGGLIYAGNRSYCHHDIEIMRFQDIQLMVK